MSLPVSPLAPATFPTLPVIKGARFASVEAGVRYQGRPDVMLAVLDPGTTIAGVFTKSATRAAPVLDCQAKLGGDSTQGAAILVNAGNANAFTGGAGAASVARITQRVADVADVPENRVFTASTGVIGEVLPDDRIIGKLDELAANLSDDNLATAAKAILTTDTFRKGSTKTVDINGQTVAIAGIAKGSGMIAPDMATMLVYIFTDAVLAQDAAQSLLGTLNAQTFNCITVDSDTSTSDTLMLACTGSSGVDVTGSATFANALHDVMRDLAHQVVRDGEGATKFVEINVDGAASADDAHKVGMAIANSPLVKTAIAGEDPNWGRIVMAVGKSGAAANRDALSIWFGDILVAENGWVADSYEEELGATYMKRPELALRVSLGVGEASATVWTCDLTHGYISINADYRS